MPNGSSLTPESRFMALFVGEKHGGKTCAAASWRDPAKNKKVKVLDGDGRIRGLLGAPWIDLSTVDYDYYPPKSAAESEKYFFFEKVNKDLEHMISEIKQGKSPYETYVCDSATTFCKNLIIDALPLTHEAGKGKRLGTLNMAGPEDYGFEATGMDGYLTFLRSLPINVIMTAHIVPKFDKPRLPSGAKDTYADSIIVGEKLSLRDKIGVNIANYFDHIFQFERKVEGGKEKFYVEYIGDYACTSFPGMPVGQQEITGKNFREFTLALANKASSVTGK